MIKPKYLCALTLILIFNGCSDSDSEDETPTSIINSIEISGDISNDVTLSPNNEYLMTGQTFVKAGATMTIEPGTTVKSLPVDQVGAAPLLVIEPGARLLAEGTRDQPITFTTSVDESSLPARGLWGGIVILGRAPINQEGGQANVEGLPGIPFGGDDAMDDSGILRYVRIWYGGREIGEGNEINGLTMAGVGAGTTIDHVEVAWNLDDGFEFFGGTVNAKNLSALYCGDDSFDMDWGYQGKAQYLFSLSGRDVCGRGFEIDNDGRSMNALPRTAPMVSNVTLIGPNGGDPGGDGTDQMIRLREGTAGRFKNVLVMNGNGVGLRISDDATQALVVFEDNDQDRNGTLFFSPDNIIFNCVDGPFHSGNPDGLSVRDENPMLRNLVSTDAGYSEIDPRLAPESPFLMLSDPFIDDPFLDNVPFIGAFDDTDNWLEGWSWLDFAGRLK